MFVLKEFRFEIFVHVIYLPPSRWLLLAIWTPLKTNLTALQLVSSCVLQSSVAGPEKKLEKAIDLAYSTLVHVQLCSHAQLDYVVHTL